MPDVRTSYEGRWAALKALCEKLDAITRKSIPIRVDRISFRPKDPDSFLRKAEKKTENGRDKYSSPLEDIEDQVAGRVLVLFRRDISTVVEGLRKIFNAVEQVHKEPSSTDAFAYESEHLVFSIPPTAHPDGWESIANRPRSFEMQVRTVFMHAWAEPQHDLNYKGTTPLTDDERRMLAWAASNAWGGDAIFERVLDSIEKRSKDVDSQVSISQQSDDGLPESRR